MFQVITSSLLWAGLLIAISLTPFSEAKDDAYEDKTSGLDVTQSVVRRIIRTNIFTEDHSYLLRIAYTESHFGTDDDTYRPNYFGGIWQLDELMFNATQVNSAVLRPLHTQIFTQFSINWTSVTWSDLVKPMYSGIGARLFLAQLTGGGATIPDTVVNQANHWKRYYRPAGSAEDFIADAHDLQNSTRCRGKMDLCIVLDGSNSIKPPAFNQARNFTASLIESFELDYTRLGMLVYSTDVNVTFPVKSNLTIAEMSGLANTVYHPQQNTATGLGMMEGIKLLAESDPIEGIPQIMAVFTDGDANIFIPPISEAVKEALNKGVSTFAVGIGDGIKYNELLQIAMNNRERVFSLAGFDSLTDFLFRLTSVTCEIPQRPEANQTYQDSLVKSERRYYEVDVPAEGISITINMKQGRTRGYWSFTEEVPSSAIYEGVLDTSQPTFIPLKANQNETSGVVYVAVEGVDNNNAYSFTANPGDMRKSGGPALYSNGALLAVAVVQALFFWTRFY